VEGLTRGAQEEVPLEGQYQGACFPCLHRRPQYDSNDTSSSSDEELKRRVEDKLNELHFFVDTTGGLYTMVLGEDVVGGGDKDTDDDSASKVSRSTKDLTTEVDELMTTLASQDKLLRLVAHERK
jgi:hypothetical protein